MKKLILVLIVIHSINQQCFAQVKKAITENYTWEDTMTSSRVIIWEDTKDWVTFDSLHKNLLFKFKDSITIIKKRNRASKKIEEFQIERYGDTLYFIQIKPYFNSQLKFVLSNTTYQIEEVFPKNSGEHFMPGDDYISRIELFQFFREILTEENNPKPSRK